MRGVNIFVIADTKTKHAGSQHQSMSEASVECQSKDFTISIQHVWFNTVHFGFRKIILLCVYLLACVTHFMTGMLITLYYVTYVIAAVNNDITCYLDNIRMLLIVMLPR